MKTQTYNYKVPGAKMLKHFDNFDPEPMFRAEQEAYYKHFGLPLRMISHQRPSWRREKKAYVKAETGKRAGGRIEAQFIRAVCGEMASKAEYLFHKSV